MSSPVPSELFVSLNCSVILRLQDYWGLSGVFQLWLTIEMTSHIACNLLPYKAATGSGWRLGWCNTWKPRAGFCSDLFWEAESVWRQTKHDVPSQGKAAHTALRLSKWLSALPARCPQGGNTPFQGTDTVPVQRIPVQSTLYSPASSTAVGSVITFADTEES